RETGRELHHVALLQLLCRAREREPGAIAGWLVQRDLDRGRAPLAEQPRLEDLGVVVDQEIAGPQQLRQVEHMAIRQRLADVEQPCSIARTRRVLRDPLRRQLEIKLGNLHWKDRRGYE